MPRMMHVVVSRNIIEVAIMGYIPAGMVVEVSGVVPIGMTTRIVTASVCPSVSAAPIVAAPAVISVWLAHIDMKAARLEMNTLGIGPLSVHPNTAQDREGNEC